MKKKLLAIVFCVSILSTLFSFNNTANASTSYLSASEVFPEDEVNLLKAKIESSLGVKFDNDLEYNYQPFWNSRPNVIRSSRPSNFPNQRGLILVTDDPYKGLIPTGHAGISFGEKLAVESLGDGVGLRPDSLWWKYKKHIFVLKVKKTTPEQDFQAASWCFRQCGSPYNFNFRDINTRTRFYCSQLIYAAYWDLYHINLNTNAFGVAVHPLELMYNPNVKLVNEFRN